MQDEIKGTTIEYVVDGEGRRIARKRDGVFTHGWIYKDALEPVGELAQEGGQWVLKKIFVYASSAHSPDYMIDVATGEKYRIFSDHLGSPRLVVNAATGAVAQKMTYDSWGIVTNHTGAGVQPFGFAGGLYDADTGLVRFGARDYDPTIGRWLDKDPIRFNGGLNWYLYVGNDPVNFIDPTGLQPAGNILVDVIQNIAQGNGSCNIPIFVGAAVGGVAGGVAGGPLAVPGGAIGGASIGSMISSVGCADDTGPEKFPSPPAPPIRELDVCSANPPNPFGPFNAGGPVIGPVPK